MGWYKNQKARHEAAKAGEPRPELDDWQGKMGRRAQAKIDAGMAEAQAHQAAKREAKGE